MASCPFSRRRFVMVLCNLRVSAWVSCEIGLSDVGRPIFRSAWRSYNPLAFTMAAELDVDRFLKRLSKLHSHFLKHKYVI